MIISVSCAWPTISAFSARHKTALKINCKLALLLSLLFDYTLTTGRRPLRCPGRWIRQTPVVWLPWDVLPNSQPTHRGRQTAGMVKNVAVAVLKQRTLFRVRGKTPSSGLFSVAEIRQSPEAIR